MAAEALSGSGNGILITNLSEYIGGASLASTVRMTGGTVSGTRMTSPTWMGPAVLLTRTTRTHRLVTAAVSPSLE